MGSRLLALALVVPAAGCYLGDFSDYHEATALAGGQSGRGGTSAGTGQGGAGAGGAHAGSSGAGQFCQSGVFTPGDGTSGASALSPSAKIAAQTCSPATDEPDECLAALKSKCCEVRQQCLMGNADCAQIQPCLVDCTASKDLGTCMDMCFGQFPLGANAYALFLGCATVLAHDECGSSDNKCSNCSLEQCADAYLDCNGDATCLQLSTCIGDCSNNQACENGCYEKHGGLKTNIKLETYLKCAGEKCATPCSQQTEGAGPDGKSAVVLLQTCPEACADTYCGACEQGACCHTREACQNNDECLKITQCVAQCPRADQRACEQKCVTDHPQGAEVYAPHAACRELYCVDDNCPWMPVNPCEVCLWTKCPGRTAFCDGDALCHQRRRCELSCQGDATCLASCRASGGAHTDQLMGDLTTCAEQLCPKQCPGGVTP